MQIHRITILLIALLFLLAPSVSRWVLNGGSEWYRIFLVWILIIAVAGWSQSWTRKRGASEQ